MSGRPSPRRRVLAAGALGGMAAAAYALTGRSTARRADQAGRQTPDAGPGDPDPLSPPPPAVGMSAPRPVPKAPAAERATLMHVVAHPDDDLFFLNPDIAQSLAAGHAVVGVCVTAAESGGRNGPRGPADPEAYARARQNALRAAYGQMAVGDPAARWTAARTRLPNGAAAEVNTLGAVTLVFLNLRKTFPDGRLRNLWVGRIGSLTTLVPPGGPVRRGYRYTRSDLEDALVHLFGVYRPTLVRTMDLDPDLQVHDRLHRRRSDHGNLSDHEDHTATAQFTWSALARYRGPGGGRQWTTESYRGYYNCRWPFNLSVPAWSAKEALLRVYSGDTPVPCADPAGCADLSMRRRVGPSGWGQSTHERYLSTVPWLLPGPDGALAAFAVLGGQAAMWTETAPGSGHWSGPRTLGGGPLVPRLSVSLSANGRWQLLGERIDELEARQQDHRRTVVLLEQQRAGGPFGRWRDLGGPDSGAAMRQLGFPVGVPTADGGLRLFARTAARVPATRLRAGDGSWTPWQRLGGPPVQEGLAALALSDGRIELYGPGRLSVVRWFQDRPGGPFRLDTALRLPTPGTPPHAVELADGSVLLAYRLAGNGQVAGFRRARGAAGFTAFPLGGQGGTGPLQLLPLPGAQGPSGTAERLLLLQRNDSGTSSTALCQATVADPPAWADGGPWLARQPAAARDARGRVVLAGLGPDARLRTAILTGSAAAAAGWTLW